MAASLHKGSVRLLACPLARLGTTMALCHLLRLPPVEVMYTLFLVSKLYTHVSHLNCFERVRNDTTGGTQAVKKTREPSPPEVIRDATC